MDKMEQQELYNEEVLDPAYEIRFCILSDRTKDEGKTSSSSKKVSLAEILVEAL
jgi:hypothetical protein